MHSQPQAHLLTFGGAYQRNWDYHQRSDNGGGINYQPTYQLGNNLGAGLVDFSATRPAGVTAANWLATLPPFWVSSPTRRLLTPARDRI